MSTRDTDEPGANKPPLFKRLGAYLRGHNVDIRNSIEEAIEESDRESPQLSDQERGMLANLLRFGELRVDDVMVPRADIIAVEEKTPLTALIALFREAQHSRLPVYRETLDDVLGLVLLKDVIGLIEVEGEGNFRWREKPLRELCRNVLFVPPSMPLRDLLLKMQSTHNHLALVIDEYGGTDGLITIEDVIEEIVGDIEDEHDEEVEQIRVQDNGSFLADARTDLEDFNELAGVELEEEESAEEVDTLGGLVVSLLGRVPQRGEIVRHPSGYEFEVLEADPRRVKRLLITPPKIGPRGDAPTPSA